MTWYVRDLRLTVFFDPATDSSSPRTWQDVAGKAPENEARQGLITQADGPFEAGRLALLTVPPGRADLVYAIGPTPEQQAPDFEKSSLGEFAAAVGAFAPAAARFLGTRGDVKRIALGAHLGWPAENRDDSYAALVELIRTVPFDLRGARDFTYQINRPRASTVLPDVSVNRVAKWASVRLSVVIADAVTNTMTRSSENHGVLLELDFSTDANRQAALPGDRLRPLFDELVRLASEIATAGDIP